MMSEDAKLNNEKADQDFKYQVFANNPSLYKDMFDEDKVVDEEDLDYITPEDDSEFKTMLRELKSYGVIDG